MNLAIIIALDFLVEESLSHLNFGNVVSNASSNQTILKPLVRAFNLAFSLRGEGIDDFNIAII